MKKVVFFDIDGTLLDDDKNLPSMTIKAIKQLKESGVFVAIATGRAPFMFENLRKELGIDSYVSMNGQYVVFEGEVIFHNPLNKDNLHQLQKKSKEHQHPLVFLNEKTMKANVDYHKYIYESLESLKFPHPDMDEKFMDTENVYQALVFCPENEEQPYKELSHHFEFIRWHRFSVDVLPLGGSKALGIKKIIEQIGFQLSDVYAFGDGLNDIEMLKAVGTGVAMGNAKEEVKQHADLVTRHVAEDGVYHGLKELGLIQ